MNETSRLSGSQGQNDAASYNRKNKSSGFLQAVVTLASAIAKASKRKDNPKSELEGYSLIRIKDFSLLNWIRKWLYIFLF